MITDAETIAWTRGAVLVRYSDPPARAERPPWVYANAFKCRNR